MHDDETVRNGAHLVCGGLSNLQRRRVDHPIDIIPVECRFDLCGEWRWVVVSKR